jgi:hypothetical protein
MRMVAEVSSSLRALFATVLSFPWDNGSADVSRRLELLGELIIGVIAETTVLALGIFMVVTVACFGLL